MYCVNFYCEEMFRMSDMQRTFHWFSSGRRHAVGCQSSALDWLTKYHEYEILIRGLTLISSPSLNFLSV